ncbi:MAG: helix-turn-helix domain-containing protein [Candidatus Heimdallarchaeota archaeon]|nr:MAG: helix-turn-helix domain-containing protein [Candidatus Heimdallarchaeota archaeon]
MRKVTIHLSPKFLFEFIPNEFFKTCERVEGKAILKYDLGKGVKIVVSEIHMKPGFMIKDMKIPPALTLLDVLEKKRNKYVCLVKVEYSDEKLEFIKLFDLKNIIFDLPASLSEDKLSFSFIGDTETIKELLKLIESLGPITIDSVQKYPLSELNIFSPLTERQQEIITLAKQTGYYEIPRKISTEELSNKLGISKSTLTEHLRKAENRIVSSLFKGI